MADMIARAMALRYQGENAKNYGLVGDGSTDNASAITAMIAALPDYSRLVLEANKTYKVSSQITITKPISIDMNGSTIICTTDDIQGILNVTADNFEIENGTIDLNGSAETTAQGCIVGISHRGTPQKKSVTIPNVPSSSGNLAITITSPLFFPTLVDNQYAINVPVLDTDTASGVATKIRQFINGYNESSIIAEPVTNNFFNTGGTDATVSFTVAVVTDSNDSSLAIAMSGCGITASSGSDVTPNLRRSGFTARNMTIKNVKREANSDYGGIMISQIDDVKIYNCKFVDLYNSSSAETLDHFPGIRAEHCTDMYIVDCNFNNCGIGTVLYGCYNVHCRNNDMPSINNTGFYVQRDSHNVNIAGGCIEGADTGITFYTTGSYADTNVPTEYNQSGVRVIGVEFKNGTSRGIQTREGSGHVIANCVFVNIASPISQGTGYRGCSHMHIHDNVFYRMADNSGTYQYAIQARNWSYCNIHDNIFARFDNAGADANKVIAIYLYDYNTYNTVHDNKIIGDANMDYGIKVGSTSTDNYIYNNWVLNPASSAISKAGSGNYYSVPSILPTSSAEVPIGNVYNSDGTATIRTS
jgi:hypothetical protein